MTRRRVRRPAQAGTSLVEVLVAMTLFAVVASGMASMATTSMRSTADNRAATSAQFIAQEEMERLRALPYEDIDDGSFQTDMAGETFGVDAVVTDDDPADGMKRIVVTVAWSGPLGPRTYALETIYTAVR